MKVALEPYVIDFLRFKGYKYFMSEMITFENQSTGILLKPCKLKPKHFFIQIEQQDYVVMNEGHKEWMWTNISENEVADLRKWQIRHFANLQSVNTQQVSL